MYRSASILEWPIPKVYKIYSALLSQTGTNAPTVTEFQNEIGEMIWTREFDGYYIGTRADDFPADKTFISIDQVDSTVHNISCAEIRGTSGSQKRQIAVSTYDTASGIPIGADDILKHSPLEIRIYTKTI